MSQHYHTMTATTLRQLYRERVGRKYAWPGGYPTFFVLSDGEALCHACAKDERSNIVRATLTARDHSGWKLEGEDINWEDPDLFCCHCNGRIESAYADA